MLSFTLVQDDLSRSRCPALIGQFKFTATRLLDDYLWLHFLLPQTKASTVGIVL